MKRFKSYYLFSFLLIGILLLLAACSGGADKSKEQVDETNEEVAEPAEVETEQDVAPLFAYVGAGLKEPFEELMTVYEEETGQKIEPSYNSSGALITQLETAKKGDLFMPGGMPFVKKVEENGHVEQVEGPIAYHTPVVVTPKGNPANITTFEDLANDDVELIVPELEATALGKTLKKIMENVDLYEEIEKQIITQVETGPKVTATLLLGQGNAALTEYSAWAKQQDQLDLIEIDPTINEVDEIPIAVLKYTTQQEAAEKFVTFVMEKGPEIFEKHGFKIEPPAK